MARVDWSAAQTCSKPPAGSRVGRTLFTVSQSTIVDRYLLAIATDGLLAAATRADMTDELLKVEPALWCIGCIQRWDTMPSQHRALSAAVTPSVNRRHSIIAYLLTAALLGCVASRPVIGWRLCPSNSTQVQMGVASTIGTYDSCCVSDACTR